MKLTHLDLFSGIGGFALAAQWAGLETIGFAEIDDYASRVLKKHWPDVPNYGDVRTVPDRNVLGDIFLITGGFPCQPFSQAGKRRGRADDRHLWPAMLDVIKRVRPAWVLAENVPGIINMEFDNCCADLESTGYEVQSVIVPACAVDAQHRRDRVWIVANATSERCTQSGAGMEIGKANSRNWKEEKATRRSNGRLFAEVDGTVLGNNGRQRETTWQPEPHHRRVVDGIPNQLDRLKCLGNAIVPQVAFELIKPMIEIERLALVNTADTATIEP